MTKRLAVLLLLLAAPSCVPGPEECELPTDCDEGTWGPICDPELRHCTNCVADSDCALPGDRCNRDLGLCGCVNHSECGREFCSDRTATCVECTLHSHCPIGWDCEGEVCRDRRRE